MIPTLNLLNGIRELLNKADEEGRGPRAWIGNLGGTMHTQRQMVGASSERSAPAQAESANRRQVCVGVQVLETQWACAGSLRTARWVVPDSSGQGHAPGT